jgi:hypothetical protein
VVSQFGQGNFAEILEVEADEPHIAAGRRAVEALRGVGRSLGVDSWLV